MSNSNQNSSKELDDLAVHLQLNNLQTMWLKDKVEAYTAQQVAEAREAERNKCFDNIGGEDIKVRAWVAKRKEALKKEKDKV